MIIKFYNIPGISTADEPYFTSFNDRSTKLYSHLVKNWTTAYYPVLYENRVKCTFDELPLTTSFNYISIDMYNKEWFFFVDSVTYINEKIYYINLVLDAIQTFYFDIYIRRFEETRKLEYSGLRDNISVDSTLYPYSLTNNDEDMPPLIVIQFKEYSDTESPINLIDPYTSQSVGYTIEDIENNMIQLPQETGYGFNFIADGLKTFYLIPNGVQISYWRYFSDLHIEEELLFSFNRNDYRDLLEKLVNHPNVINAYVTKTLPNGIHYGIHTVGGNTFKGFYLDNNMVLYDNGMIHPTYELSDPTKTQIVIKPYKYGSFVTPPRAICDSNYTQISIGEVNDLVIIPIELLEPETEYDLYCMLDVCSGVRTYWVDALPLLDIKFRQVCNSIETLQLFNDAYNTYLLQNKGSLTTGVALQKTQAWVNFGNQIFNQNAAAAFRGGMTGGTAGAIVAGVEATVTSGVDMFNTMYGIDKTIQANKENAYYSPDTIKLGNNYTNDTFNGFLDKIIMQTRVADYADVIEVRKYIGYLAHDIKPYSSFDSMLSEYTIVDGKRLVMGNATLSITGFNTRDNIVAIKDRLEKGVRFYTNIADLGK